MTWNRVALGQPLQHCLRGGTGDLQAQPGGRVYQIDQGQLLASIAATSSDCILSLDVEGAIVWASPATRDILGWWPEDLAGSHISVVTSRGGGDVNAAHLELLLAGERVDPFVNTGVKRDGSSFKAAVTLGPVHSASGEVTGVTVILRDVTAELIAQRQLQQAMEVSRVRFEQAAIPQALLDLRGHLESVNPAWCALFSHTEDYFVDCDIMSLVHPTDLRNTAHQLASLHDGTLDSLTCQGLFQDSDGHSLTLLIDATLLREPHGTPYAIAVSARDLVVVDATRRALAIQETFHEALRRRSWDSAVVLDADLAIAHVTPAVAPMLGYSPEDVLAHDGLEYANPADAPEAAAALHRLLAEPRSTERLVVRLRDSQGQWRWIECAASNCLEDPEIRGLVVNMRDITEQVQTEESLRLSETLHRAMVETAQQGIMATSPDGITMFANETMAELLGIPLDRLYAIDALALVAPVITDGSLAQPSEHLGRYEINYTHPGGGHRILNISRSSLNQDGSQSLGSLVMVSDITEARQAEDALRHRALHDPLTGLPNRYLFFDRLETAAARQQRTDGSTAVLYLDLDGFKPINDDHGHAAGDELLAEVGVRLVSIARATDTVSRLGGDEFAMICEDTDEEAAMLVAARIKDAFGAPFSVAGNSVSVLSSIGVALSPPHDFAVVVGGADQAMYRAKQLGDGQIGLARGEEQVSGDDVKRPPGTRRNGGGVSAGA